MAKGFTDSKGKFRPTGNNIRISSKSKTVEPSGMTLQQQQVVVRDFSKVLQPIGIVEHKSDGEVEGIIEVDGHEVEFGSEGEDEAIEDFRDSNGLWEEVEIEGSGVDHPITIEGERIEDGMKQWGATPSPEGSVYLTRDGIWIGGKNVLGYDEDHRPQIWKGLRRAGIKIKVEENDPSGTSSMSGALILSGMIRAGVRGDSMYIDVYQPISREQRNKIQDEMISRGVEPDDLGIDANQTGALTRERIRRMFNPIEV